MLQDRNAAGCHLQQQAVTNNATFENPNPLDFREDLGRIDYQISDSHKLMGRWMDDFNSIYLATGPGGNLPITPEIRDRPGKSAMVSETWLISPTLINEARIGASWNSQHYWNQGDTWVRTTQGFTFQRVFNSVGPYVNGIPDMSSITSFANWDGPYHTLISPTTEIEMGDTLSIVRGQHTIRTGMMIIRNRKDQNGRSPYDGSIDVQYQRQSQHHRIRALRRAAGLLQTYTEAANDPMGNYRYTEPAAFVDDYWKVSAEADPRSRPPLRVHDGDVLDGEQSGEFRSGPLEPRASRESQFERQHGARYPETFTTACSAWRTESPRTWPTWCRTPTIRPCCRCRLARRAACIPAGTLVSARGLCLFVEQQDGDPGRLRTVSMTASRGIPPSTR